MNNDPRGNHVYHASGHQEITQFIPRRFWRNEDFSSSGNLDEGREPPQGMFELRAFYATDWEYLPFYFVPPGVGRIQLWRGQHSDYTVALDLLGISSPNADRVLIIAEKDRSKLVSHKFSLYAFDPLPFRRVPTGEYVIDVPVSPVYETVYENALAAITERGISVIFTTDLAHSMAILRDSKILFDSQGYS